MGTLTFNWNISAPKPITNPLVPIGGSIVLKVTGGTGPYTWKSDKPDSFVVNPVEGADSSVKSIDLHGTSTITPGVPATITVTDDSNSQNVGTTMIIPAPAGVMSQHNLLIYNSIGRSPSSVDLIVQETGTSTLLKAVPGIIDLSKSAPLYQVEPESGATFVSCYVLNLDRLTDWKPA
jgi:hypothetical protein